MGCCATLSVYVGLVPTSPREMSGGKRRAEASELSAAETLNSAATPWLERRLPSASPKLDGLFCKRSPLFACLCRSDASRASSSGVCGAQPHAHQWILLQPGIRHLLVPFDGPLAACTRRRVREIQNVPRLSQRMINGRRRRSFRGDACLLIDGCKRDCCGFAALPSKASSLTIASRKSLCCTAQRARRTH